MNPWLDFVITVVVRFVCGFVLGCIASFIIGYRTVMRAVADGDFPVMRFLVWGAIGGIVDALVLVQADEPPEVPGFPGVIAADPGDRAYRRLGILADTALVVRPDGYVAYRGEPPDLNDLLAFLTDHFGPKA